MSHQPSIGMNSRLHSGYGLGLSEAGALSSGDLMAARSQLLSLPPDQAAQVSQRLLAGGDLAKLTGQPEQLKAALAGLGPAGMAALLGGAGDGTIAALLASLDPKQLENLKKAIVQALRDHARAQAARSSRSRRSGQSRRSYRSGGGTSRRSTGGGSSTGGSKSTGGGAPSAKTDGAKRGEGGGKPAAKGADSKTDGKDDASKTDSKDAASKADGKDAASKTDGKDAASDSAAKKPGDAGRALPFEPNERALATARDSTLGKMIKDRTAQNAHIYREAEKKTGVPASLVASVHFNEGHMGSGKGPESGFGLDPRYVSTAQGNKILARHNMGAWERGTGSDLSKRQSAVIAAEHLKSSGKAAGAEVGPNMSSKDMAVTIHAYGTGTGSKATKKAKETGRGFMFDPSDDNPHPRHPGGTSIGRNGETIKVPPGRKKGLLRWDVVVPLVNEQLGGPTGASKKADTPKAEAKPKADDTQPAQPAKASGARLEGLPERRKDAMTGSEFMAKIKGMPPGPEREKAILEQIDQGNIPESARQLKPVTVRRKGKDGKMHEMTMHVMPDYIAIGSDKDNVRIPMTPATAQKIADKTGCTLPTTQMVDDIHSKAKHSLHMDPIQWKPGKAHGRHMKSTEGAREHDRRIDRQMNGRDGSEISSGHKKDIVVPARRGQVAIYGGRWPAGGKIQGYSNKHYDGYSDYSHGARMVGRTVMVDGKAMDIRDVMADPNLAPLVSNRGPIKSPSYPVD